MRRGCIRWIFVPCLVIIDKLCASVGSNASNCLDGDSIRFVCVFVYHSFDHVSPHREVLTATERKTEVFTDCCGGHLVLGLASGLEAFSREPPCDSVGALAVRQTPETRGTAWEFLSYYPILPSRYLRDPFTISWEIDSVSSHCVCIC